MSQIEYKNIMAAVRPPRCAILIDASADDWILAARGAISCASEVWGGRHFLIVPTDGEQIDECFWEILDAYSPDYFATYSLTVADLEDARPQEFADLKSRHQKRWIEQGFESNGFDSWFADAVTQWRVGAFDIGEGLQAELIARLSPFHFRDKVVETRLTKRSRFGYPFTKMVDIITAAKRPVDRLVAPEMPQDPVMSLMLSTMTGEATNELVDGYTRQGINRSSVFDGDDAVDTLSYFLSLQGPSDSVNVRSVRYPADIAADTPFGLTMAHLGLYYNVATHHEYSEPLHVVVGDSVADFSLYYSLSRLHSGVYWVPLSWVRASSGLIRRNLVRRSQGEDPAQPSKEQKMARVLATALFEAIKYGYEEARIKLRSVTLSKAQLVAYRRQLAECSYIDSGRFESHAECVSLSEPATTCVGRVFEQNNYANHQSVIFSERRSVSPFPTPKPKNFNEIRLPHHYWLTSLEVEAYRPPSLPSLGVKIANIHGVTKESRVANDGVVYQCPNSMYFGGDVDTNTVRPRLYLPDAAEIFEEYFRVVGGKVAISDKGNYFEDTLRRFGGLAATGEFIKNPRTRGVLDKYLIKSSAKNGSVIYLKNDQRAYLNLEGLRVGDGDIDEAADLADDLIRKEVLQRGYILGCERCRLSSWYSIDVLTTHFRCGRCSLEQQYTKGHWKKPVEPHWYYKLAETIYQFYDNNSHLTVQTLYYFESSASVSFDFLPEIDVFGFPESGRKREFDVACIVDGKIVLGECKTDALRSNDVAKFELLRDKGGIQPRTVVFASALNSVSTEFRQRAAKLGNAKILTFGDLYD